MLIKIIFNFYIINKLFIIYEKKNLKINNKSTKILKL